MKQRLKQSLRNPYNWYLIILGLIAITPIFAPIFMELSETMPVFAGPAKLIYFVYSFTCHQFASRSLHLHDHQFAWCARDTGIWLGIFGVAVLARNIRFKGIKFYWLIPFVIPIALDGGIQTIATVAGLDSPFGATGDILYVSNNLTRFITGAIFGIGVSAFISPIMRRGFEDIDMRKLKQVLTPKQTIIKLSIVMLSLLAFYAISIQFWRLTSTNYLPSDVLDTAVKTPAEDLFARRENGACPAVGEDLFNYGCFF